MKNLLFSLALATAIVFYACSVDDPYDPRQETTQTDPDPEIPADPGDAADEPLVPNSQSVNFANAIAIAFSEAGATVDNPFGADVVTVENNNGHVVINATTTDTELNYVLSGVISDGSVKIYGEKKFGLVLNGVGITNPTGAAINLQNKKDCALTIVGQTNNRLIDGTTYTIPDGEKMKGTFYALGDVAVSGGGLLEVRGKYNHAFCADGALTVSGGSIHVKEAANDGIHTNDEITVTGGSLTIRSVGDGMQSDKPIEITGGSLAITTTGQKGHGIKTGENVTIASGATIAATTYGAASKGISVDGSLTITGGNITLNTAGDAIWEASESDISSASGIKCDGTFVMDDGTLTILCTGKGGKGISADGALTINDGTITVTTTGDQYVYDRNNDTAAKAIKSDSDLTVNGGKITIRTSKTEAEGLESKATLTITGGEIDIEAYDDCINAATHIQIDGGRVYCKSATNDGIDSNGTITVTGGLIVSAGGATPEDGFDCDQFTFKITGGTLIGIGGSTSKPTENVCTQRSLIFAPTARNIETIRIESTNDGTEALTFKLPKTYSSSMVLLFSSESLQASTGYAIYTGGSISGSGDFHGFYTGAAYTKGSSAGTFTTGSSAGSVTTLGNYSGGPR